MYTDKLKDTAIVICTYHRSFTGDGNKTIRSFHNQNFENFYVLFDDHHDYTNDFVSEKYGGPNVCIFNTQDFIDNGFNKEISKYHFWGSHQNPKYFYAHFRMLTFFLKNPQFDFYWFFDDDVTFDGNLKSLLSTYSDNKDDFLVIQAFKKEDYMEFPNISMINSRMEGSRGNWLGYAPGPGDNFKSTFRHIGSFFPIVRFSKKSLEHLLELHKQGFYGYSEGFVPTSLASDGYKVSSMLDEYNNFLYENNDCTLFHKGHKFDWKWL